MMTSRGEVLKLSSVRETTKVELSLLFDRLDAGAQATKVVYVSPHLLSAFDTIGVTKELLTKERGVVGVFPFGNEDGLVSAQHALFFVNPDVEMLRSLVVNLLAYTQKHTKALLHVFFVPRKPLLVEHVLNSEFQLLRSLPGLQLGEFDFDLAPLDDDLLSMQLPLAFKHLVADGDITMLHCVARMLLKLQTSRFGAIPLIRGKGTRAAKVVQMLGRMQNEVGSEFLTGLTPEIDSLFILDRTLDLVTPLASQLTYEGLIDEFYSIDCGQATFPFNLGEGSKMDAAQRILLNNNDRIFSEIRDKNFTNVASVLYNKSVLIKQSYERRKEVQQLKELKEFMKGLPEMQEMHRLIGVHTTIATEIGKRTQSMDFRRRISIEQSIIQHGNDREIVEYIEELIDKSAPITDVLRLLSMYSLVNGGLKNKTYDFFKENLMLSYGIPQVIAALFSLERCGLITRYEAKQANFSALRKQFKLWNDTLEEQQPNDIAYAYSGYAPLLVRLFEAMITHPESWGTPGDVIDLVPGEKAEIRNDVEVPGGPPITMIFVIGGITHAEISALRFVSSKLTNAGQPRHIVIVSTNVTNGTQMIDSLLPFSTEC
ncbi:putative vacuolar protein sorting-associated protein [Trypanosoma grayi]|uniref:putative vacuolar protein sorting-associated protein n=1 Tax=Trypanosoma grayi TaxID=71804 RepID=UPI0004F4A03B|nr:putative vacuolar protein sorting-associated protein [Trypanosoma grayi]KEG06465.1 putative vacuolar protein sorting-associated protein [Trypanosoma grayi]